MEHERATSEAGSDPLWDAFVDPPDEARPRAWWHWMDGNVDPEGVVRDLRWLHSVGVRGVQLFDGSMGGPLVVPAPVRPGTEAWDEAVDTAVRTASELGMELAVATSSGWSAAGGPWVEPADAMKKVVWSERVITGGGPVEVALPPLPAVAGLYQDRPRWGAAEDGRSFAVDWRVLAFPVDPAHEVLVPFRVHASAPISNSSCLTDGSFGRALALPRNPDGWSTASVEQSVGSARSRQHQAEPPRRDGGEGHGERGRGGGRQLRDIPVVEPVVARLQHAGRRPPARRVAVARR
jgi:alpha-L-rhamnosidase